MPDVIELFGQYRNKKIALYGLSTETEKAIEKLDDAFEIIGLLDGFKESGELYGKPVVPLSQVIEGKVELIIVVARPGSCRAITKRIGSICRENQITLMDIRGRDLLVESQVKYDFSHITGVTKAGLMEKIKEAEVISFDLYDTLIMRQCLSPTDVIRYVEYQLQEKGIYIADFYQKRLKSEKELSKYTAPTLKEIYKDVLKECKVNQIAAEEIAEMEWRIDYEFILLRKEVCDIFSIAYSQGKKVYVTSDTYYSREQLVRILEKCGIIEYTEVLSSSEYGTSKMQGLFDVLMEKEPGKRILHIGDDIVADIESAEAKGIESCKLYSSMELLESVGYLGLTNYTDKLSDRLKIGMFIANIFNSPFQFETKGGRIQISNSFDIGYLFCAPIICDFVIWFNRKIKELKLKTIWFGARDGYLIEKMYKMLPQSGEKVIYFLTSRMAAVRAGMESDADIRYVDGMKFSGSIEQNLMERFGIDADGIGEEDISCEEGLLRYKKTILKISKRAYKNYQKYIGSLNIGEGSIAFFDFVAKGTSQMYIKKLVKNHLTGLYFLQLEREYMADKGLDICSFYTEEETKTSAIFENYYILETLLTAPYPSVCGFDEGGKPVYSKETRKDTDIQCFQAAQEGILEYFKLYLKYCPKAELQENRKLDEVFFTLLHNITVTDEDFLNMVVEDPFFNRMTNITDLI